MNKNTNQLQNFNVYVDGELQEPSLVERSVNHVEALISRFTGNVALQARMATYDALHGSNYRQIRNDLVREKRNQEFERSIGLVAIAKK